MPSDLGINVPVERYSDKSVMEAFKLGEPPDTFIVNDKGIVQHCECGRNPKYTETLQTKLAKVLAGEDVYQEPLKQYQDALKYLKNYGNETEPVARRACRQRPSPEARPCSRSEDCRNKASPLL